MKELDRIPAGGGKRFAPRFAETHSGPHSRRSLGLEYLHVAVERLQALPRWLYRYNHRRPHVGIGGAVPASRP
ncbi:MAG: hypothetical protein QF664_07595 [Dehalococcoidia bacterium]|nr:hypothetical protein [Dehalococcoidia bacterium]